MLDWFTNIVAIVMNPVTLLLFLIVMRHVRKARLKRADNPLWASHQGRGT